MPTCIWGCEVEVRKKDRDKQWLRGFMSEISRGSNHGDWIEVNFKEIVTILNQEWEERSSNFHNYFIGYDEIKPILRSLGDMKREEALNLGWTDGMNYINWLKSMILFNLWQPQQFSYLLSKHFDLFGLIESGQAIDYKTINPSTNNQVK